MKRSLKLLTAGLCVLGLTAAAAFGFLRYQNQRTQTILGLTTEQKLQDFDALCTLLDQNYPFWQEAEQAGLIRSELYSQPWEEIAQTDTDVAYFKEIGQFLGEFQGLGHLSVLDGSMVSRLYLDHAGQRQFPALVPGAGLHRNDPLGAGIPGGAAHIQSAGSEPYRIPQYHRAQGRVSERSGKFRPGC